MRKKDEPNEPSVAPLVPSPSEIASEEEKERRRLEADEAVRARYAQKPTQGRIVLYTTDEGITWPAIVCDVDQMQPMVVGLTVFAMRGAGTRDAVDYYPGRDDKARRNTWAWPPRG